MDVATPDHWHVLPALMALKAGKHVICEKPLTLFVAEGRVLCDTAAKVGRVFQTASENRSIDSYIRIVELVRNGYIGELKRIEVTLPAGNEKRGVKEQDFLPQPVPEGFDYDMWLGQAPWAPYCPARCHNTFRWNLDYSGGRLTDWGAHLIDLAQWANDTERSGPVEVHGRGKFPPRDAVWNTAYEFSIDYRYANGVTMNVSSSRPGIKFIGSDGWIGFDGWRAPLKAGNPKMLGVEIPPEKQLYRPEYIVPRRSADGGEHRNFTEAILTGRPPYAPAETGHRTSTVAHIGNISMRLGGRRLRWDPKTERFLGDDEANAMLTRKQREPWSMKNVDSWINVG
ncbi:MAG TPA: Gfo/Idh/MocA family oxidoreductase [Planctomycetaceae bacterium]|nr:Gfo/Idh/MocA family oxidoreductase [Planctomycetaceae bacterium]